jgi:hypothetical protein
VAVYAAPGQVAPEGAVMRLVSHPGEELGAGRYVEFGEDVLDVRVNGPPGNGQHLGDLPVRQAAGDKGGNLLFQGSQFRCSGG